MYTTSLPCALESKPTPGHIHGSYSPSLSVSSIYSEIHNIFREIFCILSSQLQCGLPLPRRPSILPSIIYTSIISDLSRYPKKDRAALAILDSSVLLGCIMSVISVFLFLSKYVTPRSFLQHHSSKSSTVFLSDFLIVQVSAP